MGCVFFACTSLDYRDSAPFDQAALPVNIVRYPEARKNFFLTFDVGKDPGHLDWILETLRRRRVHAAFFVTGYFIREHPEKLRRIVAGGHSVGNHTFWHRKDYADAPTLVAELRETARLYRAVTGREMPGIWRAPGLQHINKPWMLWAARSAGYRHIDVTLATTDWCRRGDPRYLENNRFMDLFIKGIHFSRTGQAFVAGQNYGSYAGMVDDYRGVILIMHTGVYRPGNEDFVLTLDAIIDTLACRGYRFDDCGRFAQPGPRND